MIPKNTKKILLYLLKNFELNNINQISKKLKISVGSSFKISFFTRKFKCLETLLSFKLTFRAISLKCKG